MDESAKEVSAFVAPQELLQYKVMFFGMKNSPATFQCLINQVIDSTQGCDAYIDYIIIYSSTWQKHTETLRQLFQRFTTPN